MTVSKKLLRWFQISGLLLLILIITLSAIGPQKPAVKNPAHIITPIIGFELAQTPAEIADVIGSQDSAIGKQIRNDFQASINLDFAFLLVYSLFQLFLGLMLFKQGALSRLSTIFACGMIFLAGAADFFENLSLLKFLIIEPEQYKAILPALQFFTMIKWQALGLTSIIFAIAFYSLELRLGAALFGLTFLSAAAGLFFRPLIEAQTFIMGFAWAISWYKSMPYKNPWFRIEGQ